MNNAKENELVLDAITSKICELQKKISELKINIRTLETAKRALIEGNEHHEIGETLPIKTIQATTNSGSIRERIISGIKKTTADYSIDDLMKIVMQDGGKDIAKATFASTHSRIGKEGGYFIVVSKGAAKNQPHIYRKAC